VHCNRTIFRRLGGTRYLLAREHLRSALYHRTTLAGCEESVAAAIEACTDDWSRQYIRQNWQRRMADWAHYARCHSALLLQVHSTNPIESFHSTIKKDAAQAKKQWSLEGACHHISTVAARWDDLEKVAAAKVSSLTRAKQTNLLTICSFEQCICLRRRNGQGCGSYRILFNVSSSKKRKPQRKTLTMALLSARSICKEIQCSLVTVYSFVG
jgi:hypothetical protein